MHIELEFTKAGPGHVPCPSFGQVISHPEPSEPTNKLDNAFTVPSRLPVPHDMIYILAVTAVAAAPGWSKV